MIISNTTKEVIETAESKAFATMDAQTPNVVPISMVRVLSNSIWLFDFFMDKTATNLQTNNSVALIAWSGMRGMQIKGTASYVKDGDLFTEAVSWVKSQNPDRTLKALIVLNPEHVFDISPGGAFTHNQLSLH